MAYFIWLYVIPTIGMLIWTACDLRRNEYDIDGRDWAACFIPVFNLACVVLIIGIAVVVSFMWRDPVACIRDARAMVKNETDPQ